MEQRVLTLIYYIVMLFVAATCLTSWPHIEWHADAVAAAGQILAAIVAVCIALWSDRSAKALKFKEREGNTDLLVLSLTVPLQIMLKDFERISHTLHAPKAVNNPDDGIIGDQIAGFIAISKLFDLKDLQPYLSGVDRISQAVLVLSNLIDAYNTEISVYAKLTPYRLLFQAIKDSHRSKFVRIHAMTKELNEMVSARIIDRLIEKVPSIER